MFTPVYKQVKSVCCKNTEIQTWRSASKIEERQR